MRCRSFAVDLATGRVTARVKTGYLVGAERDDIAHHRRREPRRRRGRRAVRSTSRTPPTTPSRSSTRRAAPSLAEIELNVPGLERLRGVLPFGLALSPDEARLYVACAGLNAVAVVDTGRRGASTATSRPAGSRRRWPCRTTGSTLFVSSAKGLGSGPNGGRGLRRSRRAACIPATSCRARCRSSPCPTRPRSPTSTRQVVENTYRARATCAVAARASAAAAARRRPVTRPDPAHRLRREGEPHVRPGVRAAARASTATRRSTDARPRHAPSSNKDGTRVLETRRRLAQPPGARRPLRHQRQLLLRRRPVEHRASLGGRASTRTSGSR